MKTTKFKKNRTVCDCGRPTGDYREGSQQICPLCFKAGAIYKAECRAAAAKREARIAETRREEWRHVRRLVFSLLLFITVSAQADLIDRLVAVESGGRTNVVGDGGKAFGPLQIHQGVLDDYKRWTGKTVTLAECRSLQVSRGVCAAYLAHYATEARIGRPVTDEDRARIWNGGPDGWRKSATLRYWARIYGNRETPRRRRSRKPTSGTGRI